MKAQATFLLILLFIIILMMILAVGCRSHVPRYHHSPDHPLSHQTHTPCLI